MSICQHRPDDGCSFIACSSAFLDRKCLCAAEVEADMSDDDDEEFCPRCLAGLESSEHLTSRCGRDDR